MKEFVALHRRGVTAGIMAGAAILVVIAAVLVIRVAGGFDSRVVSSVAPSAERSADASQSATISPSESASPSGDETPAPEPVVGKVVLAIALRDDLQVREEAGISGTPIGELQTGDMVTVSEGPKQADGMSWWLVQARHDLFGWVAAGTDDEAYLDLRRALLSNRPATVTGLAAGESGFLVWGTDAERSGQPPGQFIGFSADGHKWERATVPGLDPGARLVAAAYGPSGWVMATSGALNESGGPILRSTDGRTWVASEPPAAGQVVPSTLVASDHGYLMVVRDDRSGTSTPGALISDDGSEWREVALPEAGQLDPAGVVVVGSEYVAWRSGAERTTFQRSSDGQSWSGLGGALPNSANDQPRLAAVGDSLWAVLTDFASGDQSVWRIGLAGSTSAWERQAAAESTFAGSAITELVSDGERLLVVGHDWTDASARIWVGADDSFTAVGVGAFFDGGKPELLTAGEAGFAAVGARYSPAGSNPVLWHSSDGATWQAEEDPMLPVVATAVVGQCPPLPRDIAEWLVIPPSVGVECFSDDPITIRGWRTVAEGCGGFFPGAFEPGWLAAPYAQSPIVLTVFPAEYGACGSAAQPPSLADLPDAQQWVDVTGHYDDAAASTCTWTPERPYINYVSRADIINTCERVFVATRVEPSPE